jgi:hypothetical protein
MKRRRYGGYSGESEDGNKMTMSLSDKNRVKNFKIDLTKKIHEKIFQDALKKAVTSQLSQSSKEQAKEIVEKELELICKSKEFKNWMRSLVMIRIKKEIHTTIAKFVKNLVIESY